MMNTNEAQLPIPRYHSSSERGTSYSMGVTFGYALIALLQFHH
jgi:hypothetical protein